MTPAEYAAWLDDPNAIRNVLVEAVANVPGAGETVFYLSVLPYTSDALDTPARQPYRAVLVREDIETTEQLTLTGQATMSIGEVGIANTDGAFDIWLNYVWTNCRIQMLHGDMRWPRRDYQPIFTGVTADIGNKSRDSVNLKIRDNLERLNAAITEHLLGGTGANQGSLIPLGFGEIVNFSPLLIEPTTWQYQVHDGAFNGLIEVRDNGVPIANDTIGWAAVVIDLAHGTFRLTSPPAGTITVSYQGDANGGYVNTVAGIVQRIVTNYGYAGNRFLPAEIDSLNFSDFDAAHRQPIGLTAGGDNVLSVIQKVTGTLGAQLTTSRAGLLQIKQIDFTTLAPTFSILPKHMELQSFTPGPREQPAASVWLTYCQNQTQQTGLPTSLPAEAISLLGQANRDTTAVDISTRTLYKLTAEPTKEETILLRRVDANNEALRRLRIRHVPRTTYQFDGYATLLQLQLGQTVRVTYPRFNLDAGVVGLVVSITSKWALGKTSLGVMV